jgi:hypothetical protein
MKRRADCRSFADIGERWYGRDVRRSFPSITAANC